MRIGVLALQGAVEEHQEALRALGVEAPSVRLPEDCQGLDGLILPGGESTTLEKLMRRYGLDQAVRREAARGMGLWGTCAGLILLAQELEGGLPDQRGLGLLPIRARRNAFGRQLDSAEVELPVAGLETPFPAVFIRAPEVVARLHPEVEELARWEGQSVAVGFRGILATSFHPELTSDRRLHQAFLDRVAAQRCGPSPQRV